MQLKKSRVQIVNFFQGFLILLFNYLCDSTADFLHHYSFMENFIVSARKYRPATFDTVVGQDSITGTLKNAIKNNYLAQAYLFCGPRGVGKTTCARIFAKTINCSNLKEGVEPCDECESCVSFNTLRSLNIHELDAASNNKVEDIRNLTDMVRVPPQIGKYSIYIIDEVHMLSSSAFNAFLKTLEEPPSHAIFILATTEKHKIIPTILSRCQIFDFNRIKTEDIIIRLRFVAEKESVTCEEEALHVIAIKADGALRDALSIFDQIISFSNGNVKYKDVIENLNLLDYEYYFRIVDASLTGDTSLLLNIFNEVLDNGFDGHNFIAGLGTHLRDLLVSRDESTLKLLDTAPAIREKYREQSARCSVQFLISALEICNSCDLSYKISKNPRLLVEISLLKMARKLEPASETVPDEKKKAISSLPDTADRKTATQDIVSEPTPKPTPTPVSAPVSPAPVSSTPASPPASPSPGASAAPVTGARTVSLKSMIGQDSGQQVPPAVPDAKSSSDETHKAPEEIKKFSESTLNEAWAKFAATLKNESPRISTQLSAVSPQIGENNLILVRLSNSALREEFDRKFKTSLTLYLSKLFGLNSIEIQSTVEEATHEDPVYYTDEQKYAHLAAKNPALKDLRRTFNLDFE
jgi:DNA polymerase III subunit gamma/tau